MNGVWNDKCKLRQVLHTRDVKRPSVGTDTIQETNSVSKEICDIPQGCIMDTIRPTSPTAVTDFPRDPAYPGTVTLADSLHLQLSTATRLPQIVATQDTIQPLVQAVQQLDNGDPGGSGHPPEAVVASTMVADIGQYGHTYINNAPQNSHRGQMADSGSNCCMTNQWQLLEDVEELTHPVSVGMALEGNGSTVEMTKCQYMGTLRIECDDGHIIRTRCFYNPYASDTIISPQAILDHSPQFTSWVQTGTRIGLPGILQFKGPNESRQITLHQQNGLYYCNSISYQIYPAHQTEIWGKASKLYSSDR